LGAACPSQFGHCPHPSNRWAEGFTDRPVENQPKRYPGAAQPAARCRICRRYSLGATHKVVLALLAVIIIHLRRADLVPPLIRK